MAYYWYFINSAASNIIMERAFVLHLSTRAAGYKKHEEPARRCSLAEA